LIGVFVMLRRLFILLACVLFASPAFATDIDVVVDISSQSMTVAIDGTPQYNWPVSTGRKGHRTPLGLFHPTRMAAVYFSKKYDNAPMPHAIFFVGGFAIHGTEYVRELGRTASHGCVRLHPANAALLYSLVRQYGAANTRIRIQS
jgi:lipoprotein-anchoring transpeptidase ErfK/SrfK